MAAKLPPAGVVRIVETVRHHLGRLHRGLVPAPVALMEMILQAWAAQAITVAADLGIADALANGPMTADELAAAVGADADALSRLLRALIGRGIFRRCRDGRYALTPLADALRSDADVSLAGMARFVGAPAHREHWSRLTDAVRSGHTVVPALRGKPFFDYLASEPALTEIFNQAMTSSSELSIAPVVAAYDFSDCGTVVDVGGGHGRLLAAVLTSAPQARGILFDLGHVVAGAPDLLSEHLVADRVRIEAGSFFDEIPTGGDAYVLKHIIHDWPDDDAVRILRNVRAAAAAGTKVLLIEQVIPPHDREFMGKWVDLEMLLLADARERTAEEYSRLLGRAGFRMTRVVATASPYSLVEGIAV
ncbi:methyltransferase [Mycobacterium kansasii]|uniref:Hydroxyneurosporene-O-methyltransferase n=3 Tax=Mycobacterium kansasii TaxID=1768 RepID=A0A1V3XNY6_MYCKA|nr:methyltransferase [Mycobacterium kansasii]AGZ50238.1 hydroxyneurosporene-O-methyltransferase [Mycobacterium kansasii ATCC 12478]ARG57920.1 hydroxyneurosporene methyltransferase [Mycobacterium kansasii]ARG63432.1 hydroxyneurosporene methyltransferase [Mycobacterium kansasii]ARG71072.1 hydroxyneurosporene methyltransferase [Mycobacterium kansasii]ARG74371.1 hydroxyneurosporene methyltransferase [Mycobacterium kansasii]